MSHTSTTFFHHVLPENNLCSPLYSVITVVAGIRRKRFYPEVGDPLWNVDQRDCCTAAEARLEGRVPHAESSPYDHPGKDSRQNFDAHAFSH